MVTASFVWAPQRAAKFAYWSNSESNGSTTIFLQQQRRLGSGLVERHHQHRLGPRDLPQKSARRAPHRRPLAGAYSKGQEYRSRFRSEHVDSPRSAPLPHRAAGTCLHRSSQTRRASRTHRVHRDGEQPGDSTDLNEGRSATSGRTTTKLAVIGRRRLTRRWPTTCAKISTTRGRTRRSRVHQDSCFPGSVHRLVQDRIPSATRQGKDDGAGADASVADTAVSVKAMMLQPGAQQAAAIPPLTTERTLAQGSAHRSNYVTAAVRERFDTTFTPVGGTAHGRVGPPHRIP